MSLLGFQRALADMAASPEECTCAILDAGPMLAEYDLTDRERRRLATMVRDPLMATNCILYRANRVTPIYVFFPMTCQVLGPDLRHELEAFWALYGGVDLQYQTETMRFARFLKGRMQAGELHNEHLAEIVSYEAAATELRFAPRGSESFTRAVHFTHDPERLLDALTRRAPIPADLARGEYKVLLDGGDDTLHVRVRKVRADVPVAQAVGA